MRWPRWTARAVRAWNKDGRYLKLEAEARDVDFPWQEPSEVLDATRAEAVQLNARYSARFARMVERLEAQEQCFETSEGDAVAKAFYQVTPMQDFEAID